MKFLSFYIFRNGGIIMTLNYAGLLNSAILPLLPVALPFPSQSNGGGAVPSFGAVFCIWLDMKNSVAPLKDIIQNFALAWLKPLCRFCMPFISFVNLLYKSSTFVVVN